MEPNIEPTGRQLLGPRPFMREIAQTICARDGLTLQLLIGNSRKRSIAWPRQEAFLLCHEAGYTSGQIGRFFDKDHTTVIYGCRAAMARRIAT